MPMAASCVAEKELNPSRVAGPSSNIVRSVLFVFILVASTFS